MHFVFLLLASVVKYRGSPGGGVNICVSVGGMPDGKEVAGQARLVDGSNSCTDGRAGQRGGSAARSESRAADVTRT